MIHVSISFPSSFLLMIFVITWVACACLGIAIPVTAGPSSSSLAKYEELFLSIPTAAGAREHLEYYTSEVHYAGSDRDYATALWTAELWRSYGLPNVTIEPFDAVLELPVSSSVTLLNTNGDIVFNATLSEDIVEEDPSTHSAWRNRTWAGGAPSGNATGLLIFVNYGSRMDYEELFDLGMEEQELKGKIAIVKYGRNTRSDKLGMACRYGLAGLLVYSDPADDGDTRGPVYPAGPWRPESSVQRGNFGTAANCPNLIAQVLSARDAAPLINSIIGGPSMPSSWAGGLKNTTYAIGPGHASVAMNIVNDNHVSSVWNVIGTIEGDQAFGEETVVIGNHRDAWLFGAVDPSSGSAAMNEVVKGFGIMLRNGWKPKRKIVVASWDSEAIGLLGAWDWTKKNNATLDNIVAYINVDIAVSGPNLTVMGVPSLQRLFEDCINLIGDPYDGNTTAGASEFALNSTKLVSRWNGTREFSRLGGGSDFGPFFNNYVVPSIDIGFRPVSGDGQYGDYGVYHSVMDSFHWMATVGDPTFLFHQSLAQLWGLMTIRLADSSILPHRLSAYASAIGDYISETSAYGRSQNYTSLDFSNLTSIHSQLQSAANYIDRIAEDYLTSPSLVPANGIPLLNARLRGFERTFFMNGGVPGRPTQRHCLIATNPDASYYAEVLPLITDAIRGRNNESTIQEGILVVAAQLQQSAFLTSQGLPPLMSASSKDDHALILGLSIGGSMAAIVLIICLIRYCRPGGRRSPHDDHVVLDETNGIDESQPPPQGDTQRYQRIMGRPNTGTNTTGNAYGSTSSR